MEGKVIGREGTGKLREDQTRIEGETGRGGGRTQK